MILSAWHFTLVSIAVAGLSTAAAEPHVVWSYETKGKIYAPPIPVDVDGDGTREVIIAASRDRRLLCLDASGQIRWELSIDDGMGDGLQAAPSAVDYDGDGKKEVFFVSKGGTAGCVAADGTLIWIRNIGDLVDYSGPVLADINSDSRIEILFGSESGTLYCLGDAGEVLWRYQGNGAIRGIPGVAMHPPSGTMRVFATFSAGTEACFSSEGDLIWSFDEPRPRKERRSGPAVGDLDGDGTLEVVSATDDFAVIVRDAFTGDERWRWKGLANVDQTSSFALVDFDGSGRLDVVCGDGAGQGGPGHVYRVRDGVPVWTADVGGSVVQGPCVGDVDGDGDMEILVCSRSKRLICLSPGGQEEWSFPSDTEVITTPAIADLDGDGTVEILMTSKDRSVYCLTVGGALDPNLLPWPMINHDPQLTGNTAGAPFRPIAAAPPAEPLQEMTLAGFGPLRLGANVVAFSFANTDSRPHRLEALAEVTRPDGSRISHLVSERQEPYARVSNRFDLQGNTGGPYRLRLRLTDLGTGETLATMEREVVLTPLEEERKELAELQAAGEAFLKKLGQGPVLARAQPALDQARNAAKQAVAAATAAISRGPGKAQSDALEAVQAALHTMRREVARLRAASSYAGAAEFAVVPETSMKKVFKDEPYLTEDTPPRDIALSLAGNEYEAFQVVVVPLWKDLTQVKVTASNLSHVGGESTIPTENIAVSRVGYVEIGPSEYNWYVEKQGSYPDVLYPDGPAEIPADQDAQPYFVTVKTDPDTVTGNYTGTLRIDAAGCPAVEIPLTVHVWDFTLSRETHLKTSMWMNAGQLASFYKFSGGVPFDVRKKWYDYHLQYRVGPVKDFPLGGGAMVEDFEYLLTHGMNCFFVPLPAHVPEESRPAFAKKLLRTRDILVEKGWSDLALLYTRDELSVMGRHEIPQAVEFSRWVHTIVPELPRLQTSPPEQALLGVADVWCPVIDHFDPVMLEERMDQGEKLWFYTVWGRPGIMIEFPATDHRIMFWECWKYGAEGFLYWGTTHWSLNMTSDARWPDVPWIPWNSQPGHNGCGYLLYPGPDAAPLGSIRFEMVRDGIEDYEYFYALRELLQKAGNRAPEDLRRHVLAVLAIDPTVVMDNKTFTEDPEAILDARAEIARLIEALTKLTR